jgi:flagellar basal-body rod protein FlgC
LLNLDWVKENITGGAFLMNFFDSLKTSATGLSAQRLRMNLISSNLANVNTPQAKEGNAYKRLDAVFEAQSAQPDFGQALADRLHPGPTGVEVVGIREDDRPPILKYDPQHPDANKDGFISLPNINVVEEMVNMISASRSYEANVTAVKSIKDMASAALDIGKV